MMKDVEIGTMGEYKVYMSIEETKKIANEHIVKLLNKTIEALRFYAAEENYYMYGTYGNTKIRNDNGRLARNVLEELGL